MKELLRHLFNHHTLSRQEARQALASIAEGKFNEYEVTSFVTVFLMRSLTTDELAGFVEALETLWVPVPLAEPAELDIVGTGGDGKNTFNISTLACMVAAGAGHRVVKHGNAAASSVTGASDVLLALGYKPAADPSKTAAELEACGFSYLHAPLFHPTLGKVAPLRKSLGLRTFFNMLGPLLNPARPSHTLIGVFSLEMVRVYEYLLQQQGRSFCLVHTLDGYDEISLTSEARITTEKGTQVWSPQQLGGRFVQAADLAGGSSVDEAARLFRTILAGKGSWAQNAVVLANAAIAMHLTGRYPSYDAAWQAAAQSLESGRAQDVLMKLLSLQKTS